ncbi:MAG: putative zinc-binding protein [Solidesulfovibrio sp.]|uniref:putative zinc-binding protein n=1 Tax=Solidesulfovibrio sp. TaxID=2910990 RepID=UPI002B1EDB63|nr:putative zinc-binding protein [Solidesulfovibrio sp.]MEA4857517.1 putative zinc-binding protein [Solidesulfovibrio sp.]
MSEKKSCCCSAAPKLVFACSGGADVGALADQVARKLTADGVAKMFCLAGIGGRVSGILKTTEAASKIVVIDGCPLNCARKSLEEAGFTDFGHVQLADLGFKKGESPVTDERVMTVAMAVAPHFANLS